MGCFKSICFTAGPPLQFQFIAKFADGLDSFAKIAEFGADTFDVGVYGTGVAKITMPQTASKICSRLRAMFWLLTR